MLTDVKPGKMLGTARFLESCETGAGDPDIEGGNEVTL